MQKPGFEPEVRVATAVPEVVLDTNVALALWLFQDPTLSALRRALGTGHLRWIVSPVLLQELQHEIRPLRCERYGSTAEAVLALVNGVARVTVANVDASRAQAMGLRCTDPNDQMFIDLAVTRRVPWLLSRDRAVLKLRRKALSHGLQIASPETWLASQPVAAPGSEAESPLRL